ncbi:MULTISPECIES: RHS repeat-associated core domain-containing protein [Pseudomonas]|uniref:RHS repeat-associated core domain-containing protein n=1 Tax=Pseudomonas TaxID=286 RepID=UPI001BEC63F2|nr:MULTISPECIES: RHS repeat-associated core domain-containing protein [Pseudomonas]MBT2340624.1 RHS repeat-associated core domain-containing protein [Pseudomonas fluorescens]MCD4532234.1 RHS repeat-associated core domain-containing protein [Pseudomonas sp. C3-2018]
MSASSMKILCRYHYDPLDRLTGLTPPERSGTQRFYQNSELVNEIDSDTQLTIVRNGEQPLAQRLSVAGVTDTTLLATDQQRSPLTALTDTELQRMAYTAYGHRSRESGLSCLLGFNGERPDSITGHYLLGQGNRAFNPVLMRFNSPDDLSPFGDGGINSYAYCGGDPVNRYDPSGNSPLRIFKLKYLSNVARPAGTSDPIPPTPSLKLPTDTQPPTRPAWPYDHLAEFELRPEKRQKRARRATAELNTRQVGQRAYKDKRIEAALLFDYMTDELKRKNPEARLVLDRDLVNKAKDINEKLENIKIPSPEVKHLQMRLLHTERRIKLDWLKRHKKDVGIHFQIRRS